MLPANAMGATRQVPTKHCARVKTVYLYSRLKSQHTEMYVIVWALEPVLKLALSFFLIKLSLKSPGVSHAQDL